MSKKKTIVLIDSLNEHDHRVKGIVNGYVDCYLEECDKYIIQKPKANIVFLYLLISSVFSVIYWISLYKYYRLRPDGIFNGIKSSINSYKKSYSLAEVIFIKYKNKNIEEIYANDLMAGFVGYLLAKRLNVSLIYDAHEIEFHRNRKNSFFRVALDVFLENMVVSFSSRIVVVNSPARDVYINLYKLPVDKIIIVSNNHFKHYFDLSLKKNSIQNKVVTIVYVGAAINNRMLENLNHDTANINVDIYGWFLRDLPKFRLNKNWFLGKKDYLDELLNVAENELSVMWCCNENVCLSYQLSLPNKFFQAISIGIPVIVNSGSYLATLVEGYELGYVYNGSNFTEIINDVGIANRYHSLRNSVFEFRDLLNTGKLEI
jgi:hypothetical protein